MLFFTLLHDKVFVVVRRGYVVALCLSICLYIFKNSNVVRLAIHIDVFVDVFDGKILINIWLVCLKSPESKPP